MGLRSTYTLHDKMADPAFYQQGEGIAEAKARLAAIETELEQSYARWEELDAI